MTLQDVSLDLLGGQISLPALRMPQHQPARVSLRNISLSELVTAIKPKQFAMSGRVNGELPLWLNNPRWLVEKGWIANSGPLTFRLYSEDDFLSCPAFTDPEILRTNLASVILQMTALGLGDIAAFPFVEAPDKRTIQDGVRLLEELGALTLNEEDVHYRVDRFRPPAGAVTG